jgi:ubiquinone/menaquinone biosynthesis C-methylase UbiE
VRVQTRGPQLAYSEIESRALDEPSRRRKAAKIISVLGHFLGRDCLDGLRVVDVGCSAGYICDALSEAGATVTGLDIDVPGLRRAASRFGDRVDFVRADGSQLPFGDAAVDVVVLNHIYEHVVDPDAVLAETRRVLRPDGVAYLGLGNRLWVLEPHHRLPFLSYLPPGLADAYLRATGRGQHYHERYRTRPALRRMAAGLHLWDYTLPVLAHPEAFRADGVPPGVNRLPAALTRLALPLLPTYIWVATRSPRGPAGARMRVSPAYLPPVLDLPVARPGADVPPAAGAPAARRRRAR